MSSTNTVLTNETSVSMIPDDIKLSRIINISLVDLAKVFNYYLEHPDDMPHAAPAWKALEAELKNKKIPSDDAVKYMLLDAFGCSVPPFVKFTSTIKLKVGPDVSVVDPPVLFDKVTINPAVPPFSMNGVKENDTYW